MISIITVDVNTKKSNDNEIVIPHFSDVHDIVFTNRVRALISRLQKTLHYYAYVDNQNSYTLPLALYRRSTYE